MRAGIIAALVASVTAVPFNRPDWPQRGQTDSDCEIVWVTEDATMTSDVTSDVTVQPVQETSSVPPETSSSSMPSWAEKGHHGHGKLHRSHHNPWSEPSATSMTQQASITSSPGTTFTSSAESAGIPSASSAAETSTPGSTESVVGHPSSVPPSYPQTSTVPSSTAAPAPAPTSAPTGSTPFPYPSGTSDMGGWVLTYSAPTQFLWDAASVNSDAHSTSYTITVSSAETVTSTVEVACTAAPTDYVQEALEGHNTFRATHSANPLIWDDKLACIAQRQAQSCIWDHLTYVNGGGYGQNLGGNSDINGSIAMWTTGEASSFDGEYGKADPGGDFEKYGHFTQVIWAYSTSVGCATFNCDGSYGTVGAGDMTVCNYFAAGNMGGEYGIYVLPATGDGSDSGGSGAGDRW